MREILFRGKKIDDGEWVYGWYEMYPFERFPVRPCIVPSESARGGYYEHVEVDPSTVGQYIGVCDKHNVKIFEGDIVTVDGVYNAGKTTLYNNEVYWNKEWAFWDGFRDKYEDKSFGFYQITIVGNIHDNPELASRIK